MTSTGRSRSRYTSADDQIVYDLVRPHTGDFDFVPLLRDNFDLSISTKKHYIECIGMYDPGKLWHELLIKNTGFGNLARVVGAPVPLIRQHLESEWLALKEQLIADADKDASKEARPDFASPDPSDVRAIKTFLAPHNDEIIRQIARNPKDVYQLSDRQFEILMAEILNDLGWDIELTPTSKDGGRDIVATIPFGGSKLLGVVECKRYSPHNKVGVEVVERFVYTIRELEKASFGMIATSSYFTKGAWNTSQRHEWQLQLYDYELICELLRSYGCYKMDSSTGLWVFPENQRAEQDAAGQPATPP